MERNLHYMRVAPLFPTTGA